jgi:hypothetical protein
MLNIFSAFPSLYFLLKEQAIKAGLHAYFLRELLTVMMEMWRVHVVSFSNDKM